MELDKKLVKDLIHASRQFYSDSDVSYLRTKAKLTRQLEDDGCNYNLIVMISDLARYAQYERVSDDIIYKCLDVLGCKLKDKGA